MASSKPFFNVTHRLVALVPAAGIGARAHQHGENHLPKQYRLLAGQAMLRHAVRALLTDPRIEEVRVAVAPDDPYAHTVLEGLPNTVCSPCGGATRAQTVLNALRDAALAPEDWVLVHDAARPGLPTDALVRLIDACLLDRVGGLLAMPVADTLKKAQPLNDHVAMTVARDGLWFAQTPQMFRAGLLLEALIRAVNAPEPPTDEAQAMEAMGYAPLLIKGSVKNTKITWPEDFEWVESWL